MNHPLPTDPPCIFNAAQIRQGIESLARGLLQLAATSQNHPNMALVGIHGGGGLLVERVHQALAILSQDNTLNLDRGMLDISLYRDDYSRLSQMPSVRSSIIPFNVDERHIVLIDDVIFTGRTTRAALEALFSLGRPARVDLAVLVDRGHREFPIQPDVVGLELKTARHQAVNVYLFDDPSQDYATLEDNKYGV